MSGRGYGSPSKADPSERIDAIFDRFQSMRDSIKMRLETMNVLVSESGVASPGSSVSVIDALKSELTRVMADAKSTHGEPPPPWNRIIDLQASIIRSQGIASSGQSSTPAKPHNPDHVSVPSSVEKQPAPKPKGRRQGVSAEKMKDSGPFEKKSFPKTVQQRQHLKDVLKTNILFSQLSDIVIEDVIDSFQEVSKRDGDVIIEQGGEGDNFYIIDSGLCDIYVAKGSGPSNKVFTAQAGGSFGELALMYNCPRAATVKANGSVTLWALDRQTFQQTMKASQSSTQEKYAEFLASVPLLKSLDAEQLGKLCDALKEKSFNDGEYIIRQGDDGQDFFVISEGEGTVRKSMAPGQPEVNVIDLHVGNFFGELALLKDQPRAASVVAKGRCVCLTLDRGAFERLLGPCQDILDRAEAAYAEADRRAALADDSGSEPQDSPLPSDDDEKPAEEVPVFRPPPRGRRTGVSAEAMTSSAPFEKKSYPKNEEQRTRLQSCLKANILFSHLTDSDLADIVDAFFAVSKRDGDVIIEQGGEGDNFYIIDSGLCDIYVAKGSGPSNKVFTAQAGGSFGELALMYNCPRAATVKANGSVTLWALDRQTFQQTMKASQSSKQEKYVEFLASVPLLESLTREEISKICDVLEVKMFNDGEYIIRQGDDGQDFFVISEGAGTVRKSMAPGQPEVSIVDLNAGNFFGELALLKDQPRAASVVAKGRCVCLTLDRGAFERLLGPCQDILDRAEAAYAEADRRAALAGDSGSEPQDSPLPSDDDEEPAEEVPVFRPPPRGRRTGVSAEAMTSSAPFEKKSYPKNEEQRTRLQSCLKANILFSHLTDSDLADIVDAFFAVSKRDGDVIIEQGGEGDNFYIIDSGLCDIYVAKGSGPSNKVFTAQAGGSFGELALMYNCPRAATVKANGSVTLWALDRQTFQQTMKASQSSKQEKYVEFLASVPLLESLTREEISKICDVLEVKMFNDGEYIIRQGDDGQDFFVISEGAGTVRKSMAPGQPEVSIVDLNAGNFFGELALLKDQPRAASVVAKGRCVCLTLDRGAFERLLGPCQDILDRAEAAYAEADRRAALAGDSGSEPQDSPLPSDDDEEPAEEVPVFRPPPRGRRTGVSAEAMTSSAPFEKKSYPKNEEQRTRLQSCLKANILFSHLTDSDLADIVDAFFAVSKRDGDVIIEQGGEGDNFYIIDSGLCDIYVAKGSGPSNKVFTAQAGGSFGELALMYNCPRAATVKANGSVTLWALDRQTFQQTMKASQSSKQEKYVEFLASVPLLESLTREEISKICDVLEVKMFNDGEYIIRQGDDGQDFFVISEGAGTVRKSMAPGQPEVSIVDLNAGNFFGELALLKDQPRAASVVAKGRCVCLTLDRGAFERLLGPCQDILDRAEAAYAEADRRAALAGDSGSEPQDSPLPSDDDEEPAEEVPVFRPPPRGRRTGVSAEAMTSSAPFEKKSYPKNEEQRTRLQSCLKANILFSHLTDSDLADIVDAFFAVSKRDGDVIIEQGGEGDNFYIIDSGLCDIYVAKGSGPSNKVFTAQAGGSFGELALMYNCPRAATVKANGSVTLWALDRQTFQQTMKASQSSKQEKYVEFLASVPLLESLTREEISKICDVLEVKMFNDGEYIIRQGDDGQDFFVISEGAGTVRKSMAPGQPEVSIVDLNAGNFFGELALLKDQPRAASVVAKGRCVCLTLDRGAFERLLGPCQDILDRAEAAYAEADRLAAEAGN